MVRCRASARLFRFQRPDARLSARTPLRAARWRLCRAEKEDDIPDLVLPPIPDSPRSTAFFLDFDGTLVDIADRPEAVQVSQATRAALGALRAATQGAVAIVTGRDIHTIDDFLSPLRLPVAGVHGLTRRDANGRVHTSDTHAATLERVHASIARRIAGEAGLIIERKTASLALHYRARADLETACADLMDEALAHADGLVLRRGKMVLELTAGHADKGTAIVAFLGEVPFAGRTPVFAGDDVTDEDAFAAINARGGISIKVGAGPTSARYRTQGPRELLTWLQEAADKWGMEGMHE